MAFDEKWDDYTLTEIRGDNIPVTMTFTNLSGLITDYALYFYGKLKVTDADSAAIVKCSTGTGEIAITDIPNKICIATIPPAQTNTLPLQRTTLYCEWKVKKSVGGTIQTVEGGRGTLTILPDVLQTPA